MSKEAKILLAISALFTFAMGLSNIFVNVFFWKQTNEYIVIAIYHLTQYIFTPVTFILAGALAKKCTGSNQGRHEVIGYQIRQSFKPGEITPDEALQIGYELAIRWTKGKHQFVVAEHMNTDNPHTHIFFNSVTLDHSRKFQDFKRSTIALRRVSDKLCIEHGLSIIEKPGLSKGYNRTEYFGDHRPPTGRDRLREIIDNSIRKTASTAMRIWSKSPRRHPAISLFSRRESRRLKCS